MILELVVVIYSLESRSIVQGLLQTTTTDCNGLLVRLVHFYSQLVLSTFGAIIRSMKQALSLVSNSLNDVLWGLISCISGRHYTNLMISINAH